MPFHIIREDITRVQADAIVNTANPEPVFGRGTDLAIYSAAGHEKLLQARKKIGKISVGEVAVTEAFELPARHLIHTVGPIWQDGNHGETETLSSCYRKSMLMAKQLGCESIAFPLISSGSYQFPKDLALEIALREIRSFLAENDMDVTLVVFDKRAYELSSELTGDVRAFINEKYAEKKREEEYKKSPLLEKFSTYFRRDQEETDSRKETQATPSEINRPPAYTIQSVQKGEEQNTGYYSASGDEEQMIGSALPEQEPSRKKKRRKLSDLKKRIGENYQECLLRLIDERGMTDAEVYKKANIDRRLFSKIRSNPSYHPKKPTAVALAMALELNMDDAIDLLGRAGIALSDANLFDLIIEYCIENRIYDLFTVNAILFEHDQLLLGG